jgi:hypothetical protein
LGIFSQSQLRTYLKFHNNTFRDVNWKILRLNKFLARWDDCPESYCHDPGVGVGVGVGVTPQGKNFNLGYIF